MQNFVLQQVGFQMVHYRDIRENSERGFVEAVFCHAVTMTFGRCLWPSEKTPSTSIVQVKAQIIGSFKGGSFNSRRLADIVNIIRQHEAEFPEWHQSVIALALCHSKETAKLFAPPVFRNEKKAKGYFFLLLSAKL